MRAVTPRRVTADDTADVDEIRALFREYASSLPFTLAFQDFEAELASLPGAYAPPRGVLLLARGVGCVGLRPLDETTCELKRLYVRPGARGSGLGRALAERALTEARAVGYSRVRLDTTPGMETAQAVYARLGFREIAAYRANPVAGVRYLELEL
jgi:GNAT superfamily N-acetyltransferase